jgi:ribosomal protein S12 methylthiotransferase accessory factor
MGDHAVEVLGSSLRTVPPSVTLARAKRMATSLGITRVTDITRLDRVGIPTYASIRPSAVLGSLCVNAGKGLKPVEAEAGAYMEAIEFALAEPGASIVRSVRATARDVLDGSKRPLAVLDLCPRIRARIRLDAPMECVQAEPLTGGKSVLVPAELVFLPFHRDRRSKEYFGATSNGLASGNTLPEATLHALCELIERDIRALQAFRDTSVPVDLATVDDSAAVLVAQIEAAGLELLVRTVANVFGLSYFAAIIHDPETLSPQLLNGGYGCHPLRSVAFIRAVTEAAQSRLSFIHGGRDDLVTHAARFRGWGRSRKLAHVKRVVSRATRGSRVSYATLPKAGEPRSVERWESFVLERLMHAGFHEAYRVPFCRHKDELQVVRVVVPRLELFSESVRRLGPRLRDHARTI